MASLLASMHGRTVLSPPYDKSISSVSTVAAVSTADNKAIPPPYIGMASSLKHNAHPPFPPLPCHPGDCKQTLINTDSSVSTITVVSTALPDATISAQPYSMFACDVQDESHVHSWLRL